MHEQKVIKAIKGKNNAKSIVSTDTSQNINVVNMLPKKQNQREWSNHIQIHTHNFQKNLSIMTYVFYSLWFNFSVNNIPYVNHLTADVSPKDKMSLLKFLHLLSFRSKTLTLSLADKQYLFKKSIMVHCRLAIFLVLIEDKIVGVLPSSSDHKSKGIDFLHSLVIPVEKVFTTPWRCFMSRLFSDR
jgi:hypothetical protein